MSNFTIVREESSPYRRSIDTTLESGMFDERLSAAARFVLIACLCLNDRKWNFNVHGLAEHLNASETTVRHALKELRDNGYLFMRRERVKGEGQYAGTSYLLYEISRSERLPEAPSFPYEPHADSPHADLPHVENAPQSDNNNKSINKNNQCVNDQSEHTHEEKFWKDFHGRDHRVPQPKKGADFEIPFEKPDIENKSETDEPVNETADDSDIPYTSAASR